MRRALLILVLAFAGLAAPAHADADAPDIGVSMLFAAFRAPRVDVLAGDSVTWHNASVRTHTVNAVDGSWASGSVPAAAAFTRRFDTPGPVAYYCRLHPSMRGELDVHRVLLSAPRDPAAPGRPYVLSGRAALPAGSIVAIQADGASASTAATAKVGEDGAFTATVTPSTTTSYHAVAAGESSPPVQVLVLDRKVTASARAKGRRVTVDARVTPASRGATVVLALRLKEHFGWWPVKTARLGADSRVRFSLPRGRKVAARVLLTASDGATELARSATFRLRW